MEYRSGSHTLHSIEYHFVWVTKYRYKILRGSISTRLRELIRQSCESRGIQIVRGNISVDHVHVLLSCPPTLAPSKIVQYIKGRSSKLLQESFPELKKQYWGQHMWARGYFCCTVGVVTEEMIKQYVENQGDKDGDEIFKITE